MKKAAIVLLALSMLLTACGCRPADLMRKVPQQTVCLAERPEKQTETADFALRLFQTGLEEGKNTLISPLSVLAALGMTANGARGETLAQLERTFGMGIEEHNATACHWLEGQTDQLKLANSIWFTNKNDFTVAQKFLETNAAYYRADAFQTALDGNACTAINNWVDRKTDGEIPQILDTIPDDAVMYLVNALAFEAEWTKPYEDTQIHTGTFTKEDGTRQNAELMYAEEHKFLQDSSASGFIKYYKGGKYAFAALLPEKSVPVADYVRSLTGQHLRELLENAEETAVNTAIPKFQVEYGAEMRDILQTMGITDAFDAGKADFTGLGTSKAGNIFINRVLHKTAITVAEQGTKAGAATAVEMLAGGAQAAEPAKTVILDRPFVYMLVDCEQNLPFFLGTMMDVGGEACPGGEGRTQPQTSTPQEIPAQPPTLDVTGGKETLQCRPDSFSWPQRQEDGTIQQITACGVRPLDFPERLPKIETQQTSLDLQWPIPPDNVVIYGLQGAEKTEIPYQNGSFSPMSGDRVYKVAAQWPYGSASYTFRAVYTQT